MTPTIYTLLIFILIAVALAYMPGPQPLKVFAGAVLPFVFIIKFLLPLLSL